MIASAFPHEIHPMVTVPHDILNKALKLTGMGLKELSLDTVKMFATDATAAGFSL